MDNPALPFPGVILLGLGATLTTDLWALFLNRAFRIPSPNYCLLGRWLLHMPEGTFKHSNILSAPQKGAECTLGWIAHYSIGILFAIAFVTVAGERWIQHPTLFPALLFGVVTVVAPLFLLQPAFGFGFAASKTPHPAQARLRSLMSHIAFGLGLYIWGLLISWLR